MESIVTKYDPRATETPSNHLLVLYSDPAYRAWLKEKYPNKIFSYTSQKFTHLKEGTGTSDDNPPVTEFVLRDDWFDLGYVKGEPGGLHIIGQYKLEDGEEYTDYLPDGVPPEEKTHNIEDRGWAYVIVEGAEGAEIRSIYTYDYPNEKWIKIADLTSATIEPTLSVIMDTGYIDASGEYKPTRYGTEPNANGLWFIQETIKSVH